MTSPKILEHLLRLDDAERPQATEQILGELAARDPIAARAYASELEQRAREVSNGKVRAVSWAQAQEQLLSDLRRRRSS